MVIVRADNSREDYMVQHTPAAFYTIGKVFTITCWEEREPNNDGLGSAPSKVTDNIAGFSKNGEPKFVQRRWFVVIKQLADSCLCL